MKIVIIGAAGQLGTDLQRTFATLPHVTSTPLTRAELDVRAYDAARATLTAHAPDVVINTAAYHKVDLCEDTAEDAFAVNAFAVRNLAQICRDLDCTLMHLSTDYVFSGERDTPYTEADTPRPLSVYGASKLAGEHFTQALAPKHFVVRTTGLYGSAAYAGNSANFIETMIRLAQAGKRIQVVADQRMTPTYTVDLARKLAQLVQTDAYGLYHITNAGACTWYEFAAAVFAHLQLRPDFGPTTSAAFGAPAQRPLYSVLAHTGLQRLGLDDLRPWQEALAAYLAEREAH